MFLCASSGIRPHGVASRPGKPCIIIPTITKHISSGATCHDRLARSSAAWSFQCKAPSTLEGHCPAATANAAVAGARGPAPRTRFPRGCGLVRSGPNKGLCMIITLDRERMLVGTAAAGDFPDSPEDGWATALAYREHVLRVVDRLRENPDAEVQVAELGKSNKRLRPWTPGDDSVRPRVLATIREALGLGLTEGMSVSRWRFPKGSGLQRDGVLLMYTDLGPKKVLLGSSAAGDFPDSPGDGWATALAYREHVLRMAERLRKDPGAEVTVAAVGRHGRRLKPWAPGDESVRPKVLARLRQWASREESSRPTVADAVRKALARAPKPGVSVTESIFPRGSGLRRDSCLYMYVTLLGKRVLLGSSGCGDFPDTPEDGWATALAYREHVLRMAERLAVDPNAEVQVAAIKGRDVRLEPWVAGDGSVRPKVLARLRAVLGQQVPSAKSAGSRVLVG